MPNPRRTAYISSGAQAAFACLLALGSLAGASSPTSTSPPTNGTTTASPPSNTTVVTPFSPAAYDRPYAGTPASYFTSSASPEVVALLQHAASNGSYPVDKYSVEHGSKVVSTIYGDWKNVSNSPAYYFVADMDVDCDGKDYQCPHNPDGQNQTDWGALAAYAVPWIVIPDHFASKLRPQFPGNNIAAVICNGNMFYGIFGDSNGDRPQVIGEASWLLARTCFPNENLNGNLGHGKADVTYIVFVGKNAILKHVNWNYITDYSELRTKGDALITNLASNVNATTAAVPPTTNKAASDTPPGPFASIISEVEKERLKEKLAEEAGEGEYYDLMKSSEKTRLPSRRRMLNRGLFASRQTVD